jgi:type II secretion system protein N
VSPRARTALLALGLTTFFVLISFPYGRYGAWFAARLGASLGAHVRAVEVAPSLSWGGPVLRASQVTVQLQDGTRFDLDELRVRPAVSISWLWLDPAVRVWLESADGQVDGTFWLGESSGFSGQLKDVDLEVLADGAAPEGVELRGRADAELDVESGPEGLRGVVNLDARKGSVAFPPYGLPVPFEELRGRFELDPESGVRVTTFELEDPALSLHAEGTLGAEPSLEQGRLDLQGELEVRNPGLRAVLADAVRLDREGHAQLRLQGTLTRPILR